jgi:hypothetical protein
MLRHNIGPFLNQARPKAAVAILRSSGRDTLNTALVHHKHAYGCNTISTQSLSLNAPVAPGRELLMDTAAAWVVWFLSWAFQPATSGKWQGCWLVLTPLRLLLALNAKKILVGHNALYRNIPTKIEPLRGDALHIPVLFAKKKESRLDPWCACGTAARPS